MYNLHTLTTKCALTPTQLIPTCEEKDVDVVTVTDIPKIVQVPAVVLLTIESSSLQQAKIEPTQRSRLTLVDVTHRHDSYHLTGAHTVNESAFMDRHRLSQLQISKLEDAYNSSQYPLPMDYHCITARTGLTYKRVRIWFRDRRARSRHAQSQIEKTSG